MLTISKIIKEMQWKSLDEDVDNLVITRNMSYLDLTSNFLTHKMNIHFDVPRTLMLNGVVGGINYTSSQYTKVVLVIGQ